MNRLGPSLLHVAGLSRLSAYSRKARLPAVTNRRWYGDRASPLVDRSGFQPEGAASGDYHSCAARPMLPVFPGCQHWSAKPCLLGGVQSPWRNGPDLNRLAASRPIPYLGAVGPWLHPTAVRSFPAAILKEEIFAHGLTNARWRAEQDSNLLTLGGLPGVLPEAPSARIRGPTRRPSLRLFVLRRQTFPGELFSYMAGQEVQKQAMGCRVVRHAAERR